MRNLPLAAVPSQTFGTSVGGQICQINIYQKMYGVFMDLSVNDVLVIGGVLCENRNRIVRSKYLGFNGDFAIIDTEGDEDPEWTGFGSGRFVLMYFENEDEMTFAGVT